MQRRAAGWWLPVGCCGRTICVPFRFLAAQKAAGRVSDLVRALQCQE